MVTSSPAAPLAPTPSPVVAAAAKKAKAAGTAAKPRANAAVPAAQRAKKAAEKSAVSSKKLAPAASQEAPKPVNPAKAPAPAPARDTKAKKPKLVRDSFTIPKDEYAAIETLKQRAAALAQPAKKSELLRAGLKALAALSDTALRNALKAVPSIKTGRPKAQPDPAAPAPAAKTATKTPRK